METLGNLSQVNPPTIYCLVSTILALIAGVYISYFCIFTFHCST